MYGDIANNDIIGDFVLIVSSAFIELPRTTFLAYKTFQQK